MGDMRSQKFSIFLKLNHEFFSSAFLHLFFSWEREIAGAVWGEGAGESLPDVQKCWRKQKTQRKKILF